MMTNDPAGQSLTATLTVVELLKVTDADVESVNEMLAGRAGSTVSRSMFALDAAALTLPAESRTQSLTVLVLFVALLKVYEAEPVQVTEKSPSTGVVAPSVSRILLASAQENVAVMVVLSLMVVLLDVVSASVKAGAVGAAVSTVIEAVE